MDARHPGVAALLLLATFAFLSLAMNTPYLEFDMFGDLPTANGLTGLGLCAIRHHAARPEWGCRRYNPVCTCCGITRQTRVDAMLTGSCHCGAVRIEVPRKPRRLTSCNCSICRRHAGLWGYYDRGKVAIVARKEVIARYSSGDKCLWLCRCAHCGCVTHWWPVSRAISRMGVNFRNFDPAVIASIRIRRFDGADTWKFLD
jgi:hypothetical protein